MQYLMFTSSAPGELPPPLPKNTGGTDSKIHRDVANIHTMVSNIHRTVLESREGNGGQNRVVSDACPPHHRINTNHRLD